MMMGLLGGSGAMSNAGGAAANYATSQGVDNSVGYGKNKYTGLLGWVQEKLGLDDQEMQDMMENAAASNKYGDVAVGNQTPGTPGGHAINELASISQLGRAGKKRQLPTIDLAGLLGGQFMVGQGGR